VSSRRTDESIETLFLCPAPVVVGTESLRWGRAGKDEKERINAEDKRPYLLLNEGCDALSEDTRRAVLERMRSLDAFEPYNDRYEERDFGRSLNKVF
jgi:hypothetical protein